MLFYLSATTASTTTATTTIYNNIRLWIECNDFRNSRLVYLWVFAGKAMLNIHDTWNMITIRLPQRLHFMYKDSIKCSLNRCKTFGVSFSIIIGRLRFSLTHFSILPSALVCVIFASSCKWLCLTSYMRLLLSYMHIFIRQYAHFGCLHLNVLFCSVALLIHDSIQVLGHCEFSL